MYKLCKTEQSAARQRQLEEGLLQAMQSQHYETISVSDLCDRLQIPRKSFYRYFSNKDGALHALLDHTLLEYESFASERAGESRALHGDLEHFFLYWLKQKPLLDALQRSNLSGVQIERAVAHALADTVMPARFLPGDSREAQQQITAFSVCGLLSMVLTWHHDGYPSTAAQMAGIAVRLLCKPLFPDAEKLI